MSKGDGVGDVSCGFPTVLWEQVDCQQHTGWLWPLCCLGVWGCVASCMGSTSKVAAIFGCVLPSLECVLGFAFSWALGAFYPLTSHQIRNFGILPSIPVGFLQVAGGNFGQP